MATVAVLGIGLLGAGFAEALLRNGHSVRVWNRTPAKAAALGAQGAQVAQTPADAVSGADRVHLVLSEDDAVDATIAAFRGSLGDGVPVIDHSTNQPARTAARFATLRGEGIRYLHAPVFMNPQNSREATGLMLIAGPKGEVDALLPALSTMTGRVWHVGERPDLAAVHKLFGNCALISMGAMMGDLLEIARVQGVPANEMLGLFEVFNAGALLPYAGKRVIAAGTRPTSFALTMARKDVRLMIESAGGPDDLVGLPAIAAAMDAAIAAGHGDQDYAVFGAPRFRR